MNNIKLAYSALKIGELLLIYGAEVYRVEDSLKRICSSYGVKNTSVFVIPKSIILTLECQNGQSLTLTRDIGDPETNLDKVDMLNSLSRYMCTETPPSKYVEQSIENIQNAREYKGYVITLMYSAASIIFCFFFGGNINDAICAGIIGAIIEILMNKLLFIKTNFVFLNAICAGVGASFAIVFVYLGLAISIDSIIMGTIMTLVPGLSLTNSMRDFILGDTLAGIITLVEAILISVGIVLGISLALATLGRIL